MPKLNLTDIAIRNLKSFTDQATIGTQRPACQASTSE
jgi:hypothetical protein